MAVKKATVEAAMAKVEAAKTAEKKTETKTAAKPAAKTAEKKTETKAAAKPATKKTETKTAAKPAAKKTTVKATENVFIEFAGGQVSTSDIIAKAVEVSGKKSIKTLNVYYQPENNKVYFTADGEEGSFDL